MLEAKNVHFIIPSFEGMGTIRACLDSIANQDYPSSLIKISIVENGPRSIDPTIIGNYQNCSYFYNPLTGRSQARNFLLDMIDSEFIAYVDVDVVLDKNWLKESLKSMSIPFCAATTGPVIRKGSSWLDHFRRKLSDNTTNSQSNTMENPTTVGCLNTAAVLMRTAVLKQLKGFDTSFLRSEDHELTHRLLRSGYIISTSANAKSEVYWDRGYREYFTTRFFQMGLYSAKANLRHGIVVPKMMNLNRMKQFEGPIVKLGWLVTHSSFYFGYKIGLWKFKQQKLWEPKITPKRFLILNEIESPRLSLYEWNPEWEIVIIREHIHLFHRTSAKFYQLQKEASQILLRILRQLSYTVDSSKSHAFINSLMRDQLILIQTPNMFVNQCNDRGTATKTMFQGQ